MSIASAADQCAERSGQEGADACARAAEITKLHNALDCGSDHIKKEEVPNYDEM